MLLLVANWLKRWKGPTQCFKKTLFAPKDFLRGGLGRVQVGAQNRSEVHLSGGRTQIVSRMTLGLCYKYSHGLVDWQGRDDNTCQRSKRFKSNTKVKTTRSLNPIESLCCWTQLRRNCWDATSVTQSQRAAALLDECLLFEALAELCG